MLYIKQTLLKKQFGVKIKESKQAYDSSSDVYNLLDTIGNQWLKPSFYILSFLLKICIQNKCIRCIRQVNQNYKFYNNNDEDRPNTEETKYV